VSVLQAKPGEPPAPPSGDGILVLEHGYRLPTGAELSRALAREGWDPNGGLLGDPYDIPRDRRPLILVNSQGRFVWRFVPRDVHVLNPSYPPTEEGAP
jgi:hypothetical protein